MDYQSFIALPVQERASHTFTNGTYAGTDEQGDDVYRVYDFWVTVRENSKGMYYESRHLPPEGYMAPEMARLQK
jgi:hypothetical protein